MAVKLRLKRMGSKQKAFYRIVVADSRSPRDGRFIEAIGTYNPVRNPKEVTVDEEKALKWLQNGAMPSDTVRSILSEVGIMKKFSESKAKKVSKPKSKVKADTETKTEAKKPAPKKPATKKATTTKKSEK